MNYNILQHRHLKVFRASFQITPLSYSAQHSVGEDERAHNLLCKKLMVLSALLSEEEAAQPFKSEISAHRSRRERHAMRMAPSSLILPPLFVLARTCICTKSV
jgi:hypothetical protein